MINNSKHQAFTLLEMTFVIVILGIVAGISSEVIATAYESYINQRAISRSSIKTELAASQIVNRLTYAIPESIVGRRAANGANTLVDISAMPPGNNNDIIALEWIGYDRDSFIARDTTPENAVNRRPGWSGFCDLTATNRPNLANAIVNLVSPGSNFNLTNVIIGNLSAGRGLTIAGAGLYFNTALQIQDGNAAYFQAGARDGIYTVANPPNIPVQPNGFSMDINAPLNTTNVGEHYKLAWTAYALVLEDGNGDGTADLVLHYNYRPWNGENWNTNGASQKILLNNVSVFRFTGTQSSIRFKICKPERTGSDSQGNPTTVAVCKEKVVIK